MNRKILKGLKEDLKYNGPSWYMMIAGMLILWMSVLIPTDTDLGCLVSLGFIIAGIATMMFGYLMRINNRILKINEKVGEIQDFLETLG